jgi:hypothetical protein
MIQVLKKTSKQKITPFWDFEKASGMFKETPCNYYNATFPQTDLHTL